MKQLLIAMLRSASLPSFAQQPKSAPTLKSILLEQLRTAHNEKDWFVPANVAIEGLTPEQANGPTGAAITLSVS